MPRAKHIQGSLDGLCGIYCLVHYLSKLPKLTRKNVSSQEAAFGALLKSAEDVGKLTASHIAGGFYAEDLAEIFNETARRKRLGNRAFKLTDVAGALDVASGVGLLREIFRYGGAAIVSVHAGTHWVLAREMSDDGSIAVQDSGHLEKYRKEEIKRIGSEYDGVALVPARSAIARALA